jgi:hypothetical protein
MPPIDVNCDLQHDYRKPEETYAIAINRARRSRYMSRWVDDTLGIYELAEHRTRIIADRRLIHTQDVLETCLYEHIERWKADTIHLSSITKMLAHPSYLRIIGLARHFQNFEVERALLQELETEPDYWFDALAAITGEDPVQEEHDFDEAVNAWLQWGRSKGII